MNYYIRDLMERVDELETEVTKLTLQEREDSVIERQKWLMSLGNTSSKPERCDYCNGFGSFCVCGIDKPDKICPVCQGTGKKPNDDGKFTLEKFTVKLNKLGMATTYIEDKNGVQESTLYIHRDLNSKLNNLWLAVRDLEEFYV